MGGVVPVSARSKQKWLTIASLKQGLIEHVAILRDGRQHAAILSYSHDASREGGPDTFIVRREVRDESGRLWENHLWWFTSLDDAREQWKSATFAIRS